MYTVERKKHKLADRSNLTFQLFRMMSKLSKVKKIFKTCACCGFEASTVELISLAYFGEEQF